MRVVLDLVRPVRVVLDREGRLGRELTPETEDPFRLWLVRRDLPELLVATVLERRPKASVSLPVVVRSSRSADPLVVWV